MRSPSYRLLLALATVVALLPSAEAEATCGPRLTGLPRSVRAGESIDIAWTHLPAGTHEVELELSLDGGRWKRISPELEAHEGHFVWRVPATAGGEARVRLRYGSQHGEQDSAPSEPFRIEGALVAGPLQVRLDDQWTGRGGFGHASASELVNRGSHFSIPGRQVVAEPPPRHELGQQNPRDPDSPFSVGRIVMAAPTSPTRSARVFTPLRN